MFKVENILRFIQSLASDKLPTKALQFFQKYKKVLIYFLFMWSSYILAREKGWLPKKSVKGKHIFITGAGSGLGRDMAIKLSILGANLSISDINIDAL
jgi:hypothetical protein